jgi:hypothetical protein
MQNRFENETIIRVWTGGDSPYPGDEGRGDGEWLTDY